MKANSPEFEKIEIPLLEEQIRKRQDLLILLDREKLKSIQTFDIDQEEIYNPLEGIFKLQDDPVLHEIR